MGNVPYSPSGKFPFHLPSLISPNSGRALTYGALFAPAIFWLTSDLLLTVAFEEKEELLVSKEVRADLVGDLDSVRGFEGRCFCSLLVGDLVGLLAPVLAILPGPTSTRSWGGGAPLGVPALSKRFAMFLTEPVGRAASVGVDLALLRVCVGALRAIAGGLRFGD